MTTESVATEVDVVTVEEGPAAPAFPELADPTPLAFAAVGLPLGVIALNLTGILSSDIGAITLPLALTYGTIGLFIAGSVAFRKGDVFGAFTYSSFAAFFLSFGLISVLLAPKITTLEPAGQGAAFATFVFGWVIIVTYLAFLSFRYPPLFRAIFVVVWFALVLLAIGFAGSSVALVVGAWLGVVAALLCLYGSAAVLINTVTGRSALPI
jgi:uncharacterized protein